MRQLHFLLCMIAIISGNARERYTLEKNWRFTREDNAVFLKTSYDDSQWEAVRIPHDWAIYGAFSPDNDPQTMAIVQDGQKDVSVHVGRTGGLPFVGTGWYRTKINIEEPVEDKVYTLIFDGAMSEAQVWINGEQAGYWPYGYNSFQIDATPYIVHGENTLAVRLDNKPMSSRWYPGAGIYRNVHLVVTGKEHVPEWGTRVTTPVVSKNYADIDITTEFNHPTGSSLSDYRIETDIMDPNGIRVGGGSTRGERFDTEFRQRIKVENPQLWDTENPHLYTAVSRIYRDKKLVDEFSTRFGIRTIEVIPEKGFFLNGKNIKFRGVCMHHDLGPLGTAVNEAAIRRQIRILKSFGANAIRTSHNMPAPELVRLCDEMGMMLMAETFDEWRKPKMANGYNRFFDSWAEKDLSALIRHYRNNPSVVMWCVGNEVDEQWWPGGEGAKTCKYLVDICHREDPTRPVTQGNDAPDQVCLNNMAAVLDIPGFNYRPHKYRENYEKLPQRVILGTETASTLSSRGVYKFPLQRKLMAKYPDHQSSGYDVEACSWSNLPEDDFIQHDDIPYCMGEFVWTGFDYLGEPTPYYNDWPSHSSLFGIVDLAGLPKDRYYLYRSHWAPELETLHILPHWTWPGRENEVTPVMVYTNSSSAELFVNGVSQGRRTKNLEITRDESADSISMQNLRRLDRYRLIWKDVRYEPGTLSVVTYDCNGKETGRKEIHTAGRPHHIELSPDRTELTADGRDLSFITVRIVDDKGNLIPDYDGKIDFKVRGAGRFRAVANGDPSCVEPFHLPHMSAFHGMLTAIVETGEESGKIVFEASGKGLRKASVILETE